MRYLYIFLLICLSTFLQCKKAEPSKLKIFKYNQSSGISSLDPAFAKNQANIWAVSQMFNGLVQLDSNLQVAPCIAKNWEFSNEGKTITFHLRTDVYFHQVDVFEQASRTVKAHDFVYSFARIVDPSLASPGSWIFNEKIADNQSFVALNDSTFQLNLKEAFGPMLGILTMPYCFVVPKEAVEKYGLDFRAHPIGTGPFQLKVWEEGTALVALKNPLYFEKDQKNQSLPYVDGFKITFMESKKMEYLSFMKGDLDMISGIDKSFVNEILDENAQLQTQWTQSLRLYKAPYLNTEYLGFNQSGKSNFAQNKAFRQAINYCINKESMIQFLRKGVGYPALNGFIPKSLAPYNEQETLGYTYQPEKAKALLVAAGYDGSEVVLHTNETYKDMALYIAKEAEKVGVKLKVEVVQPSLLREWMVSGEVDFFRGSWVADYPDAENYFSLFYSKNMAPPNYTRFANPQFDKLYEAAVKEANEPLRMRLYTQMDSILIEEAPVVFLYYDEIMRITQQNISGAKPNASNALDIKYIQKL